MPMAHPESPPAPQKSLRRRGAVTLGALVPDAVAAVLRERGFASSAVMTDWREIVGPHLAKWTSPIEIRWPRRPQQAAPKTESRVANGSVAKSTTVKPPPAVAPSARGDKSTRATLVVACPGAFALDVQMSSPAIIDAVNRRLGFGCIGALQIHQMPRPAPPPAPLVRNLDPETLRAIDATLSNIEHRELRDALARLGAEIATRGKR